MLLKQPSIVRYNRYRVFCQVATDAPSVAKVEKATLKVMIAGAPAAGKGTQCQKIVDKVAATPHPPLAGIPCRDDDIGQVYTAFTVKA